MTQNSDTTAAKMATKLEKVTDMAAPPAMSRRNARRLCALPRDLAFGKPISDELVMASIMPSLLVISPARSERVASTSMTATCRQLKLGPS